MKNILEWGHKSGPHRKTFMKRKRAPKLNDKQLCASSLSSASALIVQNSVLLHLGCCQRDNCLANHQSILQYCMFEGEGRGMRAYAYLVIK